MNNDQLNGLIALKTVAQKQNFSAAAQALNISPSAVSQAIKQLEKRLGSTLLSRTTRSTSLTEVGEQFLQQASPAIEQILGAIDDVKNYAGKPSGLLRLNLPRVVYQSFLQPIIASFVKKHPEIAVELFFEDERSEIFERGFDAGIRLSDILAQDVVALKLYGPVKFVAAASPKYLKKMGQPKHPKDLLKHNCIRCRLGESRIYDSWEFEHKGKELEVKVSGSLIFNDFAMSVDAAINHMGVIYASKDAIKDKVKAKKLEVILSNYAASSEGFYLYYPSKSQVSPKLRALIDHVRSFK